MNVYTVVIGADNTTRRISQQVEDIVLRWASVQFGGANSVRGRGSWIDGDGNHIIEERLNVTIATSAERTAIIEFASHLALALNQESVMVMTDNDVHFVAPSAMIPDTLADTIKAA